MRLVVALTLFLLIPSVARVHGSLSVQQGSSSYDVSSAEASEILPIIEDQLKALRSGDIKAAYDNFMTAAFQKATSYEAFKNLVEAHEGLSKNKLFTYHSFYIEEGMATFEGDLVSVNGSVDQAEFDLVKEDNGWKIAGLQIYKFEQSIHPRAQ